MSKPTYTQCVLKKCLSDYCTSTQVAYIESKFAVMGRILKMRVGEAWDDGWKVIEIGATTDAPPDYRKAIRGHRANTGDSLPKAAVQP